jgi:hypothetical protein
MTSVPRVSSVRTGWPAFAKQGSLRLCHPSAKANANHTKNPIANSCGNARLSRIGRERHLVTDFKSLISDLVGFQLGRVTLHSLEPHGKCMCNFLIRCWDKTCRLCGAATAYCLRCSGITVSSGLVTPPHPITLLSKRNIPPALRSAG